MVVLVFSDTHGYGVAAEALKRLDEKFHPDIFICLGDILASGEGSELISFFHLNSSRIVAVKGNCDSSYDEGTLGILLRDHRSFDYMGHTCHLTHIPTYGGVSFPPGDIVMFGHTHRKELIKEKGVVFLNPGSLSLPRDDVPSYALMDGSKITLRDRESDEVLKEIEL